MFAPGAYLCRQGEPGDSAALILRGTVKVLLSAEDGSNTMLGLCGAEELIGELAALSGEGATREASVIAVDKVTCRIIPYSQFRLLLTDRPSLQRAVTLQCADRMRLAAMAKLQNAAYPAATRIALVLLDLAGRYGRRSPDGIVIELALSQQDLAQLVVSSRESVVRALAEMRTHQLVQTGRQRITLRDPAALRDYAGLSGLPLAS